MFPSISSSDLQILQHEADQAARRLVRRLRLPLSSVADLRQELLLDLIGRYSAFDPERGSLGAFAGKVTAHKSAGIARKVQCERRLFGAKPISIDDPQRLALRDTVSEDVGFAWLPGGSCGAQESVELAQDVARAVAQLPMVLREVCALLQTDTPTAARRKSGFSHATFYRRLREIRLRFLIEGVRPAA